MRGKYQLRDWELSKWSLELAKIIDRLTRNKLHEEDLTQHDVCPANIVEILNKLGWEDDEQEDNGWQHDTWIYFSHPNHNFGITLYYEGYTFEMKLFRTDRDD